MLTRRTFFASLAALVVGGGAARLRLSAAPMWRPHPAQQAFFEAPIDQRFFVMCGRGFGRKSYLDATLFTRVPRRDDGDTLLELR